MFLQKYLFRFAEVKNNIIFVSESCLIVPRGIEKSF